MVLLAEGTSGKLLHAQFIGVIQVTPVIVMCTALVNFDPEAKLLRSKPCFPLDSRVSGRALGSLLC